MNPSPKLSLALLEVLLLVYRASIVTCRKGTTDWYSHYADCVHVWANAFTGKAIDSYINFRISACKRSYKATVLCSESGPCTTPATAISLKLIRQLVSLGGVHLLNCAKCLSVEELSQSIFVS